MILLIVLQFFEFNMAGKVTTELIKLYQQTLSQAQADVCNFEPSCSHFAYEVIEEYGLLKGILLASDRLQRCHPFAILYSKEYYEGTIKKGNRLKVIDNPQKYK